MTEYPAPYAPLYPSDAAARLQRVFEAAACRTQTELATFLCVRQSSISDAKRRGSIPPEWLVTLLLKQWVSPAWVLTGKGSRDLQPAESVGTPPSHVQPLADAKCSTPCPTESCWRRSCGACCGRLDENG